MDNQAVQDQINALRQQLEALSQEFYKNNFVSSQAFNKSVSFNSRLKVPHYDTVPASCDVGEIAESGGKLCICATANTWVISGTQS